MLGIFMFLFSLVLIYIFITANIFLYILTHFLKIFLEWGE